MKIEDLPADKKLNLLCDLAWMFATEAISLAGPLSKTRRLLVERYEEYGVEPDVMTLAKGLGFGVPIGAFMSKEHCMALVPGDHGSTFGGNPLTSAAAYAGTKFLIENDILGHVKAMEKHLSKPRPLAKVITSGSTPVRI